MSEKKKKRPELWVHSRQVSKTGLYTFQNSPSILKSYPAFQDEDKRKKHVITTSITEEDELVDRLDSIQLERFPSELANMQPLSSPGTSSADENQSGSSLGRRTSVATGSIKTARVSVHESLYESSNEADNMWWKTEYVIPNALNKQSDVVSFLLFGNLIDVASVCAVALLGGLIGAALALSPPFPYIGLGIGGAIFFVVVVSRACYNTNTSTRTHDGKQGTMRSMVDSTEATASSRRISCPPKFMDLRKIIELPSPKMDDICSKAAPSLLNDIAQFNLVICLLKGAPVAITFPNEFKGRGWNDSIIKYRARRLTETNHWLTSLNDDYSGMVQMHGIGSLDTLEAGANCPGWVPDQMNPKFAVVDCTDEIDDAFAPRQIGFARVSELCIHGSLSSFLSLNNKSNEQHYLVPNARTRLNFVLDVTNALIRLAEYSTSIKMREFYFDGEISTSTILIGDDFRAKLSGFGVETFESASSPDLNFKSSFFSSPERFQSVVQRHRSGTGDCVNEPSFNDKQWRRSFVTDLGRSWVYSLAMVMFECLTQGPLFYSEIENEMKAGFSHDVAVLRIQSDVFEKGKRPAFPREWSESGIETRCMQIMIKAWDQEPRNRPTLRDFARNLEKLVDPETGVPKPEIQVRFRKSLSQRSPNFLRSKSSKQNLKENLTSPPSVSSTPGQFAWEFVYDRSNRARCLGHGAVGSVWQYRLDGALVALKMVKNDARNKARSDKILNTFRREVTKMLSLRHPNIIAFYGACLLEDTPCMALELARSGDLRHNLHRINDETKALHVFRGIAAGLAYLHKLRIVHRDIKVDNILIAGKIADENTTDFASWTAKISDFGWADSADTLLVKKNVRGIPYWFAPEMLTSHRYSWPVDIYAFGILMWEVLMKEMPFEGYPRHEFMRVVGIGNSTAEVLLARIEHRKYSYCIESLLKLMSSCWKAPASRPSAEELSVHLDRVHRYTHAGKFKMRLLHASHRTQSGIMVPTTPRKQITKRNLTDSPMVVPRNRQKEGKRTVDRDLGGSQKYHHIQLRRSSSEHTMRGLPVSVNGNAVAGLTSSMTKFRSSPNLTEKNKTQTFDINEGAAITSEVRIKFGSQSDR